MPRRNNVELARALRQQEVPAEQRLWNELRDRQLGGFKIRRQHPVGAYVADFACVECMVVIEIDGESHLGKRREDLERTRVIEDLGWDVVRFWNTEVYDESDSVKEAIYRKLMEKTSTPLAPLSPRRFRCRCC